MSASDQTQPVIFVVDDDAGVRDSLCTLLKAKELNVAEFASGEALLARLNGAETGCVLLDYSMPGATGLDTLKAMRSQGHAIPVIMITAHGDVELAVEAMRSGAFDFIEKPWERDVLLGAIERALELDRDNRDRIQARHGARDVVSSFTPREKQVFQQLITGASNKLVARALDLSPRTVEFYRANVLQKADVQSVAELVRLAFLAKEIEL